MNSVSKLSKVWLSELETRGCSSNTLDLYKRNITEFKKFISKSAKSTSLEVEKITRENLVLALNDYKERKDKRNGRVLNRSQSSVISYYTTIKSFLNWCETCDLLIKNPIRTIKPPKNSKRVPKALSLEDCELLLEAASKSPNPERDTLLVKLGLTMGLRLSEIAGIKITSFSPSLEHPETLSVVGKGDKERIIPVPESVKESLVNYMKIRNSYSGIEKQQYLLISTRVMSTPAPLSRDGIGQAYDKILVQAGIKQLGLRVHMARHSFATHLLNSNSSDLMGVKELLGHTSVATTQIYLKVDTKKLVKSVNDNPLNKI
jgi:site-specific recombinase XerD